MEFVLLFADVRGVRAHEPARMAEMGAFARELAGARILKRGAPLAPESAAACVRVREGRPLVSDGPFAETKEVIGGFWVIDVADRAAALEVAGRCPHARHAAVFVHRVLVRSQFGDSEAGAPYLLVFRLEAGSSDPDFASGREMRAFAEELARAATLFETAQLAQVEAPARVAVRDGERLVTASPLAESREVVVGYGLVRAASREEAIALAARFPHAHRGSVEVREVLFFDRV